MGREQLGPYTLSWPEGVFPLGGDALALGEFATVRPRWRVCDLGTGSGALLLMLSAKMPLAVSVIGFFLSFFYVAFFFFGYFYTPIRIFTLGEPFVMVCMFIPFWLVLLVRSAWAHKKALLEPGRPE